MSITRTAVRMQCISDYERGCWQGSSLSSYSSVPSVKLPTQLWYLCGDSRDNTDNTIVLPSEVSMRILKTQLN